MEYLLDGLTVKEHLLRLAEEGNKPFTESLNPGVEHVLGIRIPALRRLAARIARTDWEAYLDTADTFYMEERMLQGMVLGCVKPDADVEVYLHRVTKFVWIINSWSVCDTFKFGGGKKFIATHADRPWEYLKEWMRAEGEYEVRFGVVMAMSLFHRRGSHCRTPLLPRRHPPRRLLREDGGGVGAVGVLRQVPHPHDGLPPPQPPRHIYL